MVTADDFKDYKKGFNNQYVCFEYPFLWNDIKSEEEDEFTDVVLHDKQHNSIVKISTKPCSFNTVDELKKAVEDELNENNCEIQQSAVESLGHLDIWDIFYITGSMIRWEIQRETGIFRFRMKDGLFWEETF